MQDKGDNLFTRQDLMYLQSLPLNLKIQKSVAKILEWHVRQEGKTYVSFSGGKDSTVLLHLVRQVYPDTPAVFVNTGLEYPEVVAHATAQNNVTVLRPKKNFRQVIADHGYPVISKDVSKTIESYRKGTQWAVDRMNGVDRNGTPHTFREALYKRWRHLPDAPFKISNTCCYHMKEAPLHKYARETGRKPIMGTLAVESRNRTKGWLKVGCNSFSGNKRERSAPLSFWLEQDILEYIKIHNLPIAKVYGQVVEDGKGRLKTSLCQRTGCSFCLFGCHLEKQPNRIQRMASTHPKLYEYCLRDWEQGGLGLQKVMEYLEIPHTPQQGEENANTKI